ncbi:SDR family NAD(P)-dependent oxidoreductase [Nocardia asteroides]|uniref:SDR family NAD(P)-dependent oxidoreductase n=1 Tax=Nocardia asteroides TaxID=1824 RepID=UPI0037A03203
MTVLVGARDAHRGAAAVEKLRADGADARLIQLWPAAAVPYPASKTALTMLTAMYAKEFWDTPIKVNAANPGYCATDFNANSGFRTAEQGAEVSVHLATLPAEGPTGQLWGYRWGAADGIEYGVLPW